MKRIFAFIARLFSPRFFTPKQTPESPAVQEIDQTPHPSRQDRRDKSPETEKPLPKKKPRPKKPRWKLEDFPVEPEEGKVRFHDLDLPLGLMHAIADLEFKYCTDIQAQLLPHTLEGKDATAKAQTGTGKSATFIIAMIKSFTTKRFKPKVGYPRALILAPTRELVHQIEKDFKGLAKYSHLRILSVFGGTGYAKQQQVLQEKPVDVIAATPGRLLDFIRQKIVDLSRVEVVVIDEADRMLDMGFIPDVRRLVYMTPHKDKRQTMFFSATLTDEVLRLADSWTTKDRVQIEIDPEQAAADSINQIVYLTTEDQKCAVLSGDVSQDKRFKVLERFKKGTISILVATDVAARGLHIENISHVVNYDMPIEPEHYIHRIGRTGRAGATGTSVSFADEMSSFQIPKIEEVLGHSLTCEYPSEALEQDLPKPKPRPRQQQGKSRNQGQRRRRPRRRRRPPRKFNKKPT